LSSSNGHRQILELKIEKGLQESQLVLALLSPHYVRRADSLGNSSSTDSVCLLGKKDGAPGSAAANRGMTVLVKAPQEPVRRLERPTGHRTEPR
jgi:hypothetical protein